MSALARNAVHRGLLLYQLKSMPQLLLITTAVSAAKSTARMSMLVATWSDLTVYPWHAACMQCMVQQGILSENVLFTAHSLC